jgi:hypothetical protein
VRTNGERLSGHVPSYDFVPTVANAAWYADIVRFIYLINLLDTNEKFFYHNLME